MRLTKLSFALATAGTALVSAFPADFEADNAVDILTGRAIGSACSTPDGSGSCQQTSSCTTNGFSVAGYCPNDPSSVECCVQKTCSTSSGSGVCTSTSSACSGRFVSGACPGSTSIQCCAAAKCTTSSGSGTCQDTGSACGGQYIAGACACPSSIQCCVPKTTCSTSSGSGVCQNTATACSGGQYIADACPGPANIECCVKSTTTNCTTADGAGVCQNTATACNGGHYVAGACPGPSNIECCVSGSAPPPPPPSGDLKGCDVSSAPPSSFYSCAKSNGLQKIVARGYSQSCGSGGAVDNNMITVYKAAKAAGIPSFDAYLYPCTGTSNGVTCKSIQTQLNEFLGAINSNGITVNYLWLDIEPTSTAAGDPCNSWQLGASGNEALAKQWVAAIKASGRKWGIYANAGQWTSMFASSSTDIGSDLPLWAVQDDYKPGVATTTRFMGGWTKAYAKQYNLGTTLCSASVDLDSFTA